MLNTGVEAASGMNDDIWRQINISGFRIELSQEGELVRKYGKKIKALGGQYDHCRGHRSTRTVYFPMTEEGAELADILLGLYSRGTRRDRREVFIFNLDGMQFHSAGVTVKYIDPDKTEGSLVQAAVNEVLASIDSFVRTNPRLRHIETDSFERAVTLALREQTAAQAAESRAQDDIDRLEEQLKELWAELPTIEKRRADADGAVFDAKLNLTGEMAYAATTAYEAAKSADGGA